MKTCDEMMQSLLERREAYRTAQKKKKTVLLSVTSTLCVVALMGVVLWQSGWMTPPAVTEPQGGTEEPQESEKPTMPSYPILWGTEACVSHNTGEMVDSDVYEQDATNSCVRRYLKICGKQLGDFLSNNESTEKIALFVRSYDYETALFEFLHNGKTVAEYQQDVEDYQTRLQKMERLVGGEGEDLAIGRDAYTSQSSYKETCEWLGKELVDTYVVDGVFLAEKAQEDLIALKNDRTVRVAYDEACRAYQRYAAAQLKPILEQKGFDCYYTEGDEYLLFFATEEEFVSFNLGAEEYNNWKYDLATEPIPMQAVGYLNWDFVYKGKTVEGHYAQWRYYYYNLEERYYNLIHEEGKLLEKGRDLYLTTDPDGNPWPDICGEPFTKQTYDYYVKYYGDMLTKYIVDGKFLKEKAQADLKAIEKEREEAIKLYEEACDAAQQHNATQIKEKLEQMGCECTYTDDGKGLLFRITNQAYVTLPLDVKVGGFFKWVKLNADGTIYVDYDNGIDDGTIYVD